MKVKTMVSISVFKFMKQDLFVEILLRWFNSKRFFQPLTSTRFRFDFLLQSVQYIEATHRESSIMVGCNTI